MAVYVQSVRDMMTTYLAYIDNVTYASASVTEIPAALAALQDGYRRYLSGEYVDNAGNSQAYVWSFVKADAEIALRTGRASYDLPLDYQGDVDRYTYDYSTSTVGESLEIVDHPELMALRRDDNESGLPRKCSVRANAFTVAAGTTYEWAVWPTPAAATVTQLTTNVTRVTGLDFTSALVGTTIEISGATTGTVQSITSTDILVVDSNQTVGTATAAYYETGETVNYHYRKALPALANETDEYPAGLIGCGDLIVQAARAIEEHESSGQDGSETARYYRYMNEMVIRDRKVIPGALQQKTLDVGSRNKWRSRR